MTDKKRIVFSLVVVILVVGAIWGAAGCEPTEPLSPEEFYATRTLTVICPGAPGGGSDYAARLFAQYWPEFVEGGAAEVINVTGGGGVVGQNQAANAKPDGLTIGVFGERGSAFLQSFFGSEGIEYELDELNYVGEFGGDTIGFQIAPGLPYESMEDLVNLTGLRGPVATVESYSTIAEVLVAMTYNFTEDFTIIPGYGGHSEMVLALSQGEVDVYASTTAACIKSAEDEFVKPVWLIVGYNRSAALPEVPAIVEEVEEFSEDEQMLLDVLTSVGIGKPFFFGPDVPQDRVEFVRGVFEAMMQDEDFLSDAALRWTVWEQPKSGEQVAAEVADLIAMSLLKDDVLALLQQYVFEG